MLYKTGRADGSHTNKGANMKEEWKVCNVYKHHILDGEPESARCCPIALAMEQIVAKDSKYNGYSPVISNAKDMHLEHLQGDDEELPLSIDVYEEDRLEVDNFIRDFDATYGDETAPLPLPIRFRYRIIDKSQRDAIARLSKEIENDKKETK